jgi:hypothetical protein
MKGCGKARPDRLVASLECQIVGFVKLADAGSVAAAAKVFEQQRIVEVVQLFRRQAKRATDVDSDPAAADADRLLPGSSYRPG